MPKASAISSKVSAFTILPSSTKASMMAAVPSTPSGSIWLVPSPLMRPEQPMVWKRSISVGQLESQMSNQARWLDLRARAWMRKS